MLEGVFKVERSHDPVLSGRNGQFHKTGTTTQHREASCLGHLGAACAPVPRLGGIAPVRTILDHIDLGEDSGKRANRGGLSCPLLAADEDSSDPGVDSVEQQRDLKIVLTYDRAERVRAPGVLAHVTPPTADSLPTLYGRQAADATHIMGSDGTASAQTDFHWKLPHSAGVLSPALGQVLAYTQSSHV
ncbi:MAG: hypothetical protein Kow0067_08180 [Coriobacteriia bacterium]